ncbi:hypothetical protein DRO26_03755 [Candidatus Bathyarchaeota archaeon]|nr:MAG: hypothetical protein DRO26_03755 [Candidatus Bathyarchaeota archaeon]
MLEHILRGKNLEKRWWRPLPAQNELAIVLEHVKKFYDGYVKPIKVFEDVNLKIRKGEFVAAVGPTGCGKTTLINLIAGFDHPQNGNIYVEGVNITKLKEDEITVFRAKNIGVVFQLHNLIPNLTVQENVELPLVLLGVDREVRKRRVEEVLKQTWISHHSDRKVATLSVGECQLVSIARALAPNPSIILMDEPLECLDALTTDMMLAFFKGEVFRRKTVLITTHKKKVIQLAERVIHLKKKLP